MIRYCTHIMVAIRLLGRHVFVACVAVMVALMPVSCSDSGPDFGSAGDDDDSPQMSAEVHAGFYVTVGDAATSVTTGSRAPSTPDGGYDPGSGYENYIDIPSGDYRFLFFTGDADGGQSTFLAPFEVTGIVPVSGTATSKTYHVLGKVSKKLLTTATFRVMVLANWRGSYPTDFSGMTIDQVCGSLESVFSFDPSADMAVSAARPIPLYGIDLFSDVVFDSNDFTDIGTIHLLRAYAKVDVIFSDVSHRLKLKSVQLTRWHDSGYMTPSGTYERNDYVKDDYDSDYTAAPHIPSGAVVKDTPLDFTDVNGDGTLFRIYVPEFRNVIDGIPVSEHGRARIKVHFVNRETGADGYFGPQYLDFMYYADGDGHHAGEFFNLMRNYWYKYTLIKTNELSTPEAKVIVIPYKGVDLDPVFGLDEALN